MDPADIIRRKWAEHPPLAPPANDVFHGPPALDGGPDPAEFLPKPNPVPPGLIGPGPTAGDPIHDPPGLIGPGPTAGGPGWGTISPANPGRIYPAEPPRPMPYETGGVHPALHNMILQAVHARMQRLVAAGHNPWDAMVGRRRF